MSTVTSLGESQEYGEKGASLVSHVTVLRKSYYLLSAVPMYWPDRCLCCHHFSPSYGGPPFRYRPGRRIARPAFTAAGQVAGCEGRVWCGQQERQGQGCLARPERGPSVGMLPAGRVWPPTAASNTPPWHGGRKIWPLLRFTGHGADIGEGCPGGNNGLLAWRIEPSPRSTEM